MDRIAIVEITAPTEYTDRSFQTALWWETVLLLPGQYDVVPWSNLPYYNHFKVPATVIADNFASNFAGCSIQPYDTTKNEGKETHKWIGFPGKYDIEKRPELIDKWLEHHPTYRIIEKSW